jgi:hypothetical protein
MAKKFFIDDLKWYKDIEKVFDAFAGYYERTPGKTKPKGPTLKIINSRVDRAYLRLVMRTEKLPAKLAAWKVAGEMCDELPNKYPDRGALANKLLSKIYHK